MTRPVLRVLPRTGDYVAFRLTTPDGLHAIGAFEGVLLHSLQPNPARIVGETVRMVDELLHKIDNRRRGIPEICDLMRKRGARTKFRSVVMVDEDHRTLQLEGVKRTYRWKECEFA